MAIAASCWGRGGGESGSWYFSTVECTEAESVHSFRGEEGTSEEINRQSSRRRGYS